MTAPPPNPIPSDPYSDAPPLHPNFVLGGLHLLFWLVFHPSAFRNHLARIDPTLRPDFALIDLDWQQWRKPALLRLLAQAFLISTLPSNSVLAFLMLTQGRSLISVVISLMISVVLSVVFGLIGGVLVVLAGSRAVVRANSVVVGVALSLVNSVVLSLAGNVVVGLESGVGDILALGLAFGLVFGLTFSLAFGIVGIVTFYLMSIVAGVLLGLLVGVAANNGVIGALIGSVPSGLGMLFGLTFHLWRPLLLWPLFTLYSLLLLRRETERAVGKPSLLRRHPAFWDEFQRLRWIGLDEHLVLVAERDAAEGQAALAYLAESSFQRWAAQAAQIELDARRLERCVDVDAIGAVHSSLGAGELAGPTSALLRAFSRVSQDAATALRQENSYNRRLAFVPVSEKLDGLLRELTRSDERYALRFRPVAEGWRSTVAAHIQALQAAAEQRQEIDNPYIIAVPLDAMQQIFIGRADIGARIEQLLLDRRRPPLLLYGQRRMGKTSLLNNLGRLLPSSIVPLFVDLQGPVSQAGNYASMFAALTRSMAASARTQRGIKLPALAAEAIAADPFSAFYTWLDDMEQRLGDATALLLLDEFEALERAFSRGRFDAEEVLSMLRHIIQHRPRCKLLLAGSHTLEEFRRWASYLINVQVVRVGYLNADEVGKLIEAPAPDFTLRYTPEARARVLALTRGHPFLVQLLCSELVVWKNEQEPAVRRLARLEDVEAAAERALTSGDMFFADIQRNQVDETGRALLHAIAARGEGGSAGRAALQPCAPAGLDAALERLLQRELIETGDDGYRFQVELIRRWFARARGDGGGAMTW